MKKAMLGLLGIMLVATLAPAAADAADDWKFAVTPYLWGAGVNGTATVKRHEADVDQSFSDLLSDLDFAMMVNVLARKERFGLYGDVLYLGVTDTTPVTNAAGVTLLEAETSVDSWIIDFGASWEATRWGGSGAGKAGFLDLTFGGRYWTMDTEIKAESQFFAGERSVSQSMGWVDPVLGARFITDLTPKLRLIGAGDIGGFDIGDASKLTWSASAYLGWRFSPMISAWAGYKHLAIEREDDKNNSIDLAFSGPVLGVSFTF
jgi:hypothetical protein